MRADIPYRNAEGKLTCLTLYSFKQIGKVLEKQQREREKAMLYGKEAIVEMHTSIINALIQHQKWARKNKLKQMWRKILGWFSHGT